MINIPDSVFLKDDAGNLLCPKCQRLVKDCDCPSFEPAKTTTSPIKPLVRIDRSGRKGKIVTQIQRLPANEPYIKQISKELKVRTGSGGTAYLDGGFGVIEIQGDHKKVVEDFLRKI